MSASANSALLSLNKYSQQQTQWCWAAITQTVANYFGHYKPQCRMASRFIKTQPGEYCCTAAKAGSSECNQPYYLDRSIGHYNMLNQFTGGTLPTTSVVGQIGAKRPVGMRIGWNGGGGHFILAYGARHDVTFHGFPPKPKVIETFHVWDPANGGDAAVVARAGVTNYKSAGSWTHSYTTVDPD